MSVQDSGTMDNVSVLDIFKTLFHHWRGIAVFTASMTAMAVVYYVTRPELYTAKLFLNPAQYEILFDARNPSVPGQHLRLSESPEFVERISKRLASEGLLAGEAGGAAAIPRAYLPSYREAMSVSVELTTAKKAIRALEIWAEEYTNVVGRYRGSKLISDLGRDTALISRDIAINEAVLESLRATLSDTNGHAATPTFNNSLEELEFVILAAKEKRKVYQELVSRLKRLSDEPGKEIGSESQDHLDGYVQQLIQAGKDKLLGDPMMVARATRTRTKVAVVFLLSLFFSCGAVLVIDWTRRDVRWHDVR